jgi:hypothetical protein
LILATECLLIPVDNEIVTRTTKGVRVLHADATQNAFTFASVLVKERGLHSLRVLPLCSAAERDHVTGSRKVWSTRLSRSPTSSPPA